MSRSAGLRAGPTGDFISFIRPLIKQMMREMGGGMKALVSKAFIPLSISLIICFVRGRMKEMKCGMEMSEMGLAGTRAGMSKTAQL